ncbi:MAG TPA: trehalose-6-phosphate synthase, partial [Vicinamibacterales bacterium]|nr:trehalose-6-phosphate synthase [Vicinamibacterales bacterium]
LLQDKIPLDSQGWDTYWRINERFADAVAARANPGDVIWVHDYHLLVLPGLLRQRLPDARIGFFLHIPFPPADLFRVLPWRRPILDGLLGADHIGFHTRGYARHFLTAVEDVLGIETYGGRLMSGSRTITTAAHPMGIDAPGFDQMGRSADVAALRQAFHDDGAGRRLLLGLDRLDYTKGIPRRLLAFERLLEESPDLRGSVRLVQVAVPSRGQVESYRAFRREIEEIVGRINGRFGTVSNVPIHYLHRSFTAEEVVAMYQAADVMVVTPLRDGMNLVAKEFVASRVDEDGVLVLSEFAGASAQLPEALQVNPFDIPGTAAAMAKALSMPEGERRQRMRRLRQHVFDYDVHRWVREFLANVQGPPVTGRWLEARWPDRPPVGAPYFSTSPASASTSR